MIRWILTLLIAISPAYAFRGETGHNEHGKPATIKALIVKNSEGLLIEVKGSYRVTNPQNGRSLSSGKNKRYYAFTKGDGLKWGETYPGVFQIRIMPTSASTTVLVNGVQYRGAVEVYNIENRLSVINEVDVESYLKSTLMRNVPQDLPISVADSIAIVERTNAYYSALINHDAYWHVVASDVGYEGYATTLMNPVMDRAIDNTRHLVMTYDAQPFASTWNANCAGRTASYHSIFRKNTATPAGITSPFALKDRKDFSWSFTMPSEELSSLAKTNRVTGVELFVENHSNKVYAIRIKDGVHEVDMNFTPLQKALGKNRLKSNDFTVKVVGNSVTFTGFGEGCGVGLCLYSASQMASAGELAPKILADFYPLTHLEKMRCYPEMIISPSKEYFISPKRHRAVN